MHDDSVEIEFPIEFHVEGIPVSAQSSGKNKAAWKDLVLKAARVVVPDHKFASTRSHSISIFDFPVDAGVGDVDNIIKPIQDALNTVIYLDDEQVVRVVAQRLTDADITSLENAPEYMLRALIYERPFVYIIVGDNPLGELQ